MPISITAHPGSFIPAPYSGAPAVPSVNAIRPSAMAGRSSGRGAQSEWSALLAPPSPPLPREDGIRSNGAGPTGAQVASASGPFLAQRIAQETQRENPSAERLATARTAYARMRDSHIELLPSRAALDLRV